MLIEMSFDAIAALLDVVAECSDYTADVTDCCSDDVAIIGSGCDISPENPSHGSPDSD